MSRSLLFHSACWYTKAYVKYYHKVLDVGIRAFLYVSRSKGARYQKDANVSISNDASLVFSS